MKTIYFNMQSKGGAGKSMLTYLQGIKNEDNEKALFVDMDSSTLTSSRQLGFLKHKKRLAEISLLNSLRKVERDKIISIIENLNRLENFDQIYMDLGASESEQMPNLFSIDYSVEEFKEFEASLDVRFVFNIVVAGGAAYVSSFEYVKTISRLLAGQFEIHIYLNQHTFYNHEPLADELKGFVNKAKGMIASIKSFGDLHPDRYSTKQIIDYIMAGKGMADYNSFSARTIIKRELAKL